MQKKNHLSILSAIIWMFFGFGLAYTAFYKDNTWIALLGFVMGAFWLFQLIKILRVHMNTK